MAMMIRGIAALSALSATLVLVLPCLSQVTTGEILGLVQDPSGAAVLGAVVTARNLETNAAHTALTDPEGRFRFAQLPVGPYEVAVEKAAFARYVQGPIVLRLNQDADLAIALRLAPATETVTVLADASLINTTNADVGVNFDPRRISELPLTPTRNILNLALSVPGVAQLQSNQNTIALIVGIVGFSANGMRIRSNNFMIDGQDSNFLYQSGLVQQINNPDLVAEVRLLTGQFAPEYGRAAGSVVNIITRAGTNRFHGSAFWFHNDNHLNSRSNVDKAPVGDPPQPKFASAPFRIESQFGGTVGGPIRKEKTFFFVSAQRWTDREFGSGSTIQGVPTEEGRRLLSQLTGDRMTIRALLEHLPPAQAPLPGRTAPLNVSGRALGIPLGTLSGSTNIQFDDWQWSGRVDHRLSASHTLGGRYLFDDRIRARDGQRTPPGLTTDEPQRRQSATAFWNSTLAPTVYNELRLSYNRIAAVRSGTDPKAEQIPAIQVLELGLTGVLPDPTRTALGLPANLPLSNFTDTYQLQETLGISRGSHSMKLGMDFRRVSSTAFFVSTFRGFLTYNTLQDLADDVAQVARINSPLPGGGSPQAFRFNDYFFFLQDEWRARPSLTLTYGIRYESPGDFMENLRQTNRSIVAAAAGNPLFAMSPVAGRDTNNWAPRFGFNYRVPRAPHLLRRLTGDGKMVLRGGYARVFDFPLATIGLAVLGSFPFVKSAQLAPRTPNSWASLPVAAAMPVLNDLNQVRQTPGENFRGPFAEQLALQLQRELSPNWAVSLGYVGTKGTALYQAVDGNPNVPGSGGRRVDAGHGPIQFFCNCTSSIYHSFQAVLEKRLSANFSMGAAYTWGSFIDGASDIINPSASGEVAIAQDAFNRRANRGRSAYDRPHHLVANGVYELPLTQGRKSLTAKLLGGWQVSGFLTIQSGAPFTVLNGADPGLRDTLGAGSIRANVNTVLNLRRMSVEQIVAAGGARLFSRATAASPLGNIGRNILRADGIANIDLGLFKNVRVRKSQTLQVRAEFYNIANTRNFGIPEAVVSSANFLNQWGREGGNRRVVLALRYLF